MASVLIQITETPPGGDLVDLLNATSVTSDSSLVKLVESRQYAKLLEDGVLSNSKAILSLSDEGAV